MKINAFFANRLQTPLYNHVWSWGAVNEASKRVFLRTNEQHIYSDQDGDWALIYDPEWYRSPGHSERLQHIDAIQSGYQAFAVIYRMNERNKIVDFDDHNLLCLGSVVVEDGLTYAKAVSEVSIDSLFGSHRESSVVHDITDAFRGTRLVTERESLVNTRIGQGTFRTMVLRKWDYRCAVTGVSALAAIRASHIKPWRKSSRSERLDPYNGLPLVATLDALFDEGLITFDKHGALLTSPQLLPTDVEILALLNLRLSHPLHARSKPFLTYHRNEVFLNSH